MTIMKTRSRSGRTISEAERRARGQQQLRARVPQSVHEAYAREAAKRGVSIAALVREQLTHAPWSAENTKLETETVAEAKASPREEDEALLLARIIREGTETKYRATNSSWHKVHEIVSDLRRLARDRLGSPGGPLEAKLIGKTASFLAQSFENRYAEDKGRRELLEALGQAEDEVISVILKKLEGVGSSAEST